MSDDDLYMGAVGLVIELTIKELNENTGIESIVDVSDATIKRIHIRKPNGVVLQKPSTFKTDGTDGIVQYITILGDLDIAGLYKCQAYISTPSFTGYSSIVSFTVGQNL